MIKENLNLDGYVICKSFVAPGMILQAKSWLENIYQLGKDVPVSLSPDFEKSTGALRKIRNLYWYDKSFWGNWIARTGLAQLAMDLIGPGASLIRHASFVKAPYCGTAVPPHQDQALWKLEYPSAISIWIPLVDTTIENGCLEVWPRTHFLGELPHTKTFGDEWHAGCDVRSSDSTKKYCPMSAGSLIAWNRYTVHGSGSNMTSSARLGIVFVFADSESRRFYSPNRFDLRTLEL